MMCVIAMTQSNWNNQLYFIKCKIIGSIHFTPATSSVIPLLWAELWELHWNKSNRHELGIVLLLSVEDQIWTERLQPKEIAVC